MNEDDENALRTASVDFFRNNAAEFDVKIRFAIDSDRMAIEKASVVLPDGSSPYRTVARLVLPPQEAYDRETQQVVDSKLSSSPAYSLAAHRPPGGIMRTRIAVCSALSTMRHDEYQKAMIEPAAAAEVRA